MPTEREKYIQKQITSQKTQDNLRSLMGTNPQGTLLRRSANLNVSDSTWTPIFWDVVISDGPGWFNPTTSTRITLNAPGLYMFFWGQAYNSTNATGQSYLGLYVNGTIVNPGNPAFASDDTSRQSSTSMVLLANAGDYFELFAWQNSGGSRGFGGTSPPILTPFFSVVG